MPTPNQQLFGTNTNPYTGLSSSNTLFNAPNQQTPFGTVTVNGQTNPLNQDGVINNSPVMNSNVLNGNGAMPQMPQPSQPSITPQNYVAGLQPIQLAPSGAGVGAQEGTRSALQKRLAEAQQQLQGKGSEQLRLEGEVGISQKQKEIGTLNEQFAATKAAFDSKMAGVATNTFGVESQDTRISKINRQSAIQLGGMAMVLQAKQGNLDAAKAEVDRVLELEFEPIKQEIENTKTFLEMNYQDLSRADKKQAEALNRRLDLQKQELGFFYDIKKAAINEAIKTNPELANKYANASSFSDFANINASDLSSSTTPSEKVEALNNTLSLLNSIKDSNGLNSRVGPVALARRIGAISDAFGAGDAFAGSVHQLTSQQTLQALINLKAQGGALGALSDGERRALEAAATRIGAWELKDGSGVGKGVWDVTQKEFKKELDKLTILTNTAIERAGGKPGLLNDDYQEVQLLMQAPIGFNPSNYYASTP